MNTVVIDLEMNPVQRSNRALCKSCRDEIIEIGAVMLDEENNEIDSFKTYVKPRYSNSVAGKIADLTGIRTYMLQDAPEFEEAITRFEKWAGSRGDFRLVTWSGSDKAQMERESALKGFSDEAILEKFRDSMDIQIDYSVLSGEKNHPSLEKALWTLGIMFEGAAHDALYDARNTGTLFALVTDPAEFRRQYNSVKEKMGANSGAVTLGSLIDFSKFDFAIV